jgi:hypothetical protein
MEITRYDLCVNGVHKTTVGHRPGCTQAKKHGEGETGISRHPVFESSDELKLFAMELLATNPEYSFQWCTFCSAA